MKSNPSFQSAFPAAIPLHYTVYSDYYRYRPGQHRTGSGYFLVPEIIYHNFVIFLASQFCRNF